MSSSQEDDVRKDGTSRALSKERTEPEYEWNQ